MTEPINHLKIDRLTVKIYEGRPDMGAAAAADLVEEIEKLLTQKEEVNIVFAAAPSQNEFLASLALYHRLEWERINAFHMDEYVGLDEGHPERFGNFLKGKIFDVVPFRHIYYMNGKDDPFAECQRYTDLLHKFPPDIICMGIGENTHLAFNDPHVADFDDPLMVKIVNLDEVSRRQQVHDGCFKTIKEVPVSAITLTVPTLLRADYIYCIVPGSNKAEAIYHTLHDTVSEKYPSTSLRRHPNAILYLDKESAARLPDDQLINNS